MRRYQSLYLQNRFLQRPIILWMILIWHNKQQVTPITLFGYHHLINHDDLQDVLQDDVLHDDIDHSEILGVRGASRLDVHFPANDLL